MILKTLDLVVYSYKDGVSLCRSLERIKWVVGSSHTLENIAGQPGVFLETWVGI